MKMRHMMLPFVLILLLAACNKEAPETRRGVPVDVQAMTFRVEPVNRPVNYTTSGTVTSDHRVIVSSRLSGYIRKVAVHEGERVKQGQLLFRIDPVDARQAYEQAVADLKDIEADLQRYRGLLAENAVSQQQFDKIKLKFTVANSRLLQAKNQLQYADVKSTVNGVVVEKLANAGNLASPGSPILIVEDPASLLVETYVSEKVISDLHQGDNVEFFVPALEHAVAGTIRQIVGAADPSSHQFLVKAAIEDVSGIFPGMFVEVHFSIGSRQALFVPLAAIVSRAGLEGIYIIDDEGISHYRQLRLGQSQGAEVEVLAGLQAGQLIAWQSTDTLRSGQRVTAE